MKYLLLLTTLLTASLTNIAQTRNYDDTAILFSQGNNNGSARYMAMSGAFGALGGDISSIDNPAGLAIFNGSEAAITFNNRSTSIESDFYNSKASISNDYISIPQIGGVLVFDNDKTHWNKFTVGINMTKTYDFKNDFLIKGNSGASNEFYFHEPLDTADLYTNVISQEMTSNTTGSNGRVNFTVSAQYDKKTAVGISLLAHSIEYLQVVNISEKSSDINNNTLDASTIQKLKIEGDGISFNIGIVSKLTTNLRAGLAYQTPIWYDLREDNSENLTLLLSNNLDALPHFVEPNSFEYQLKTPSKTTASLAYVFGKKGLISADYSYKNYNKTKLSPTNDFEGVNGNENENLSTKLSGTSKINIGGEYRIKKISLRAGFYLEENPFIDTKKEYAQGYSTGIGFKLFANTKLDFAFNQFSSTDKYRYIDSPKFSNFDISNKNISATISIGL